MAYIWQHSDWPNFTWSADLVQGTIYRYAMEASALIGHVAHLSDENKSDALIDIMVSEAIKTSQIEGEDLNRDDVHSSICNQLGLNTPHKRVSDPRANGAARLMVAVQQSFDKELDEGLLFAWHDMLISEPMQRERIEVGMWRTSTQPMQIVSGAIGREKVHYEAPPSSEMKAQMDAMIKWFNDNSDLQAPIRSAIAHLYFESIHPFSDGNGRIGRAISELALSQELKHPVLLSLSTTIEAKRNEYYDELAKASSGSCDITEWIVWFTQLVLDAQLQAKEQLNFVLAKARFWDVHVESLNARQAKTISRMLQEGRCGFEGGMSAQKYMKMTDCSKATATRDLTDLCQKGCMIKSEEGGRSTRYDVNLNE